MKVFYQTDPGKVRDHNEDNVIVVENNKGEKILIVADGMGGHRKGEVASIMALEHLTEKFLELDTVGTKIEAVQWLNESVSIINSEILKHARKHEDSHGMGTTLVVSIVTNDFLLFGNIGDSSGYVYKNNLIHKVTKDHTLVNLLVDVGNITDEEAKHHPKKNVLMKALGVNEEVEMDIFGVDGPYDGIMLCSDGLTTMLSDEQIESVINEDISIEKRVNKIIDKCNSRGGTDNISVALLLKESGDNNDC
ncbi:MAG: Stp1/IreP family PP2C-type Ser/Thr phosphatase [bacterium]